MRLQGRLSLVRKLMATAIAVTGFVLLYETTMFDSRESGTGPAVNPTLPAPGSRLAFTATAYCKGTTTASGVSVRTGIAAADPSILPVGSVVNLTSDERRYNGVYTIMDTGPSVQGRLIDLYIWSCHEALAFGRRAVDLTVLRFGWNPQASTPSLIDRLFRRREAARANRPVSVPSSAPTSPPAVPKPPAPEPFEAEEDEGDERVSQEEAGGMAPAAPPDEPAAPDSGAPAGGLPLHP